LLVRLEKELEPIKKAKDYSVRGVVNDVNKFLTEVKNKKNETSLVASSSTDAADPFKVCSCLD
jgi:hypothetical protein